jgi:hypothetical protein
MATIDLTLQDDANRANSADAGADWSADTMGFSGFKFAINSNQFAPTNGAYSEMWFDVDDH